MEEEEAESGNDDTGGGRGIAVTSGEGRYLYDVHTGRGGGG